MDGERRARSGWARRTRTLALAGLCLLWPAVTAAAPNPSSTVAPPTGVDASPTVAGRPTSAAGTAATLGPTPSSLGSVSAALLSATPTPARVVLVPTLASSAVLTNVAPVAVTPTSSALVRPDLLPTPGAPLLTGVIGTSQAGRPLTVFQLGSGPRAVLVVGGIDGGTEGNTTALVEQLIDTLVGQPGLVPPELTLIFVPAANPDGVAAGERWLADGVDENRNFPTGDWTPDTYVAGPTLIVGGGGSAPFSEPETRDLAAFVRQVRPDLIVSYHSAAGLVMSGPGAQRLGLNATYATTAGYATGSWTAYPVTGDFAQWAEDQGVPTVEIELPDHTTTDFDANLDAFRAVLAQLASAR